MSLTETIQQMEEQVIKLQKSQDRMLVLGSLVQIVTAAFLGWSLSVRFDVWSTIPWGFLFTAWAVFTWSTLSYIRHLRRSNRELTIVMRSGP